MKELAERLGIISEYVDQTGRQRRRTSDATRETLLSIMGFDAPTEEAAAAWLEELEHEQREMLLDPVRVITRDDPSAQRVVIRLPPGAGSVDVEVTLEEEAGHVWRVNDQMRRSGTIELPTHVPYGYHRISVRVRGRSTEWTADQSLIIVPNSCASPDKILGEGKRAMGIVANLYAMRREEDWGVGDLSTLTQLVEWAGARGAAFVGVNPLHALFNRRWDISPYSPVSRLFRNHIYIDVHEVPELEESERARALVSSSQIQERLQTSRDTKLVDYDAVIALKSNILFELYLTFRERAIASHTPRAHEYQDFVKLREPELTRYATWMALAEQSDCPDWRAWPESLRDPQSSAVAAFREANSERVDFHRWLQFETHRQLANAAMRASLSGLEVGVYQDLAIGTSPGGSDTWSYPELFLTGASVGAPPDPYAATGQIWGLPPMDPRVLRQQKYRYWIQLLKRAFESAGALRIDHIMGLFRMFWIPDGGTGHDGAYVRFPADDLLGILALESVRHNALVVGEDLGTVPKEVPPTLAKWGVLSSKVLYFERAQKGFKPASRYPKLALATANTHDLPTLAGFWTERDIELRTEVGLLDKSEVAAAKRQRASDKAALVRQLRLKEPHSFDQKQFLQRFAGGVHDFLCSSPSCLVGLSLDDLIGEVEPVNVPGVGPDKYPSWRRRSRMTMEEISWNFEVDDTLRCTSRRTSRS